ncbi:hypothetical protein ACJIZ3_021965 [Penstemon smallii]|uniref:Uncharacterized protein n=1 Tax=Penstemon smallii TaxID=265156 RepID=A0ABD3SMX1_9LAMI
MNSTSSNHPSCDGSVKKIRKPYTITKSRESWSDEEHDKFIEALQLFDRDWKKIEDFISSKTVIQIRSHAQKYFLKVQKNGTVAHVPPPRPKRKAAHPYPQKATKNANKEVKEYTRNIYSYVKEPRNLLLVGRHFRIPDFAEVYSFIGSVFDSDSKDHVHKLKEMDPINFETVLLLMKNLSVNLSSPDFEPIRKVLSSYDVGTKTVEASAETVISAE